jgi:hypothetical protein
MTMLNNSPLFYGITAMSDQAKPVKVMCYAGSRAEEYPLHFYHHELLIEVSRIIEQWQTPDYRCFRVLGDDGFCYTLKYEKLADQWKIMPGAKQCVSK